MIIYLFLGVLRSNLGYLNPKKGLKSQLNDTEQNDDRTENCILLEI